MVPEECVQVMVETGAFAGTVQLMLKLPPSWTSKGSGSLGAMVTSIGASGPEADIIYSVRKGPLIVNGFSCWH